MSAPVHSVRIEAESSDDAASAVRRILRAAATAFECDIDIDVLTVLTTELISNAVRAGTGDIHIEVQRLPGPIVRVMVSDDGGGWPTMRRPEPLSDGGGRGLLIVNALADAWGADTSGEDGRTNVWFEVHPPAGSSGTAARDGGSESGSGDERRTGTASSSAPGSLAMA